ncbi:unnamed protein product [Allacma fusca]|uniref:Uncharacterized protein n=1 Tax=Allacma fusca TaxID=39272 RepID=A0A8J2PEP8_9HEXA|nr:unnamed protein product [Allacma fusca]
MPFDALSFEQAFPPPEWMSGYLFGLQTALTDHLAGEEQSSSVFYSGTFNPNDMHIQMQPQYSHAQLNTGNPALMVHLPGTLNCDGDHCADADIDHHQSHPIGMDFGDGGAGAAGF